MVISATLTPVMAPATATTGGEMVLEEILVLECFPDLRDNDISLIKSQTSSYFSLIRDQVDVVVQLTPDHLLSFVSPSSSIAWGYTPQELVSKSIWSLVHPDDVQSFQAALSAAPSSKTASMKSLYRRITKDGQFVLEEVNVIPVLKGGILLHFNMLSRVVEEPCYTSSLASPAMSYSSSTRSVSDNEDSSSSCSPAHFSSSPASPFSDSFKIGSTGSEPLLLADHVRAWTSKTSLSQQFDLDLHTSPSSSSAYPSKKRPHQECFPTDLTQYWGSSETKIQRLYEDGLELGVGTGTGAEEIEADDLAFELSLNHAW
jgi:PAS domain S-box-containing protein